MECVTDRIRRFCKTSYAFASEEQASEAGRQAGLQQCQYDPASCNLSEYVWAKDTSKYIVGTQVHNTSLQIRGHCLRYGDESFNWIY